MMGHTMQLVLPWRNIHDSSPFEKMRYMMNQRNSHTTFRECILDTPLRVENTPTIRIPSLARKDEEPHTTFYLFKHFVTTTETMGDLIDR